MIRRSYGIAVVFSVLTLAACSPSAPPTAADAAPDLLALVKAYEEAHNADDVETVITMFSATATMEMVGLGIMPDLKSIRALHEYDVGIQTKLQFTNCAAADSTVTCEVTENNDWLDAAGLGSLHYPSSVFTFSTDGTIQHTLATMSEDDARAMGQVLQEFVPWLHNDREDASATLFDQNGHFIYSEENGRLVVQMLREWRGIE